MLSQESDKEAVLKILNLLKHTDTHRGSVV